MIKKSTGWSDFDPVIKEFFVLDILKIQERPKIVIDVIKDIGSNIETVKLLQ